MDAKVSAPVAPAATEDTTLFAILIALSFSHLVNDVIQSLVPAIYPVLKTNFGLDFSQIGLITLAFQLTASLLQPFIGSYTDRHPSPYSLMVGMGFTLVGLLLLSVAPNYPVLLAAAALVGTGSSVFHPEASRVARTASGGRHGLAQSLFQVGGNSGQALGPLMAAFIVVPRGQGSIAWFAVLALLGIVVLAGIGHWYAGRVARTRMRPAMATPSRTLLSRRHVLVSVGILLVLIFSKYFYLASLSSYYTFFLIHKFALSVQQAQLMLFLFLGAAAAGTFLGGPIGDRIGRRYVIWGSILGVLPFTLVLPYVNLVCTGLLTVAIGLILSSAFSAILVYATELLPGRVGTVAGLFFGFAFGMGGLGAALLGVLADHTSIEFVYRVCAFLPALGLFAYFLPRLGEGRHA